MARRNNSRKGPRFDGPHSLAQSFVNSVLNSHLVTPVFLIFCGALVISCFLMYGDYMTTLDGYLEFPTRKYDKMISYAVAAGPMVGQIVFFYIFGAGISGRWLALGGALACHVFDVGFDIYYKVDGSNFNWAGLWSFSDQAADLWWAILWAIIESELVFQLLSEIFFVASISVLPVLFPHFIRHMAKTIRDTKSEYRKLRYPGLNSTGRSTTSFPSGRKVNNSPSYRTEPRYPAQTMNDVMVDPTEVRERLKEIARGNRSGDSFHP